MDRITVKAPAKINLTLDITGRRGDGYHFMKMVMQAVGLCDTMTLTPRQSGIALTCNRQDLPCDERNLAHRAAQAFFAAVGLSPNVKIDIQKSIPMQAGLAGGSADAAGVLVGLNALTGAGLTQEELCTIGLVLGADVPFCIRGGTVLAEGIGEIFSPLPSMPPCWILIAKPREGMSTADSFRRFDALPSPPLVDHDQVIAALAMGNLPVLAQSLGNVLESVAQLSAIGSLKAQMLSRGALGACMTGSGTAVFGLFSEKSAAKKCMRALMGQAQSVFLTQPVGYGAFVQP